MRSNKFVDEDGTLASDYQALDEPIKKNRAVNKANRNFRSVAVTAACVTTLAFFSSAALLTKQSASCNGGRLCLRSSTTPVLPVAQPRRGAMWEMRIDDVLQFLQSPGTHVMRDPRAWTEKVWAEQFSDFYKSFGKSSEYEEDSTEYQSRALIFQQNIRQIYKHNLGIEPLDQNNSKVQLSPNQFADMTFEEFRNRHLVSKEHDLKMNFNSRFKRSTIDGSVLKYISQNSLPQEVDWRNQGCVTSIKNQAKCGSCWAFSSTGAVEGAICAQTGKLPNLSEQQLVDCAGPEGTHGCNGGFMDNAFQYILDNQGICSEKDYPYEGVQGECRAKKCENAVKIVGMLDLPRRDVQSLLAGVAFYGPVSVGIEADRPAFQFYHEGVFNAKCGKQLNHAVLVTGYGTEDGNDFWLVKNSWGDRWGDQGYIKISRQPHHKLHGECGILLAPTIPLVEGRQGPPFDELPAPLKAED